MNRFLICALLFSGCTFSTLTVASSPGSAQPEEAARKGLKLYSQMIAQDATVDFGSHRPTDVKAQDALRAKVASPLAVYSVSIEKLMSFTSSQNPRALLEDTHSFIYPVSIDGKFKSSVRVRQVQNLWHVAAVDESPEPIAIIMQAATALGDAKAGQLSYLEIPDLNVFFVARIQPDGITLAPVYDAPELGLKGGVRASAQELFADLAVKLNKMREEPHHRDD
jgi:hypothetical protein